MQAIERIITDNNWITLVIVFAIILLALMKLLAPNKLFGYTLAFFTPGFFKKKVTPFALLMESLHSSIPWGEIRSTTETMNVPTASPLSSMIGDAPYMSLIRAPLRQHMPITGRVIHGIEMQASPYGLVQDMYTSRQSMLESGPMARKWR